ncbi:MAG TPA: alkaline phosphatase family protein [Ktedonobacterales bacterium]|jgi:phospholipase C
MLRILRLAALPILMMLASCSSAPIGTSGTTPAPTFSPTGLTASNATPSATNAPGAAIPNFTHIFVILMENEEYSNVVGSGEAPYITGLAHQYAQALNFYGTSHPSLPNYLELLGGNTFSITSDCSSCFVNATNLVDQLEAGHKTWKAYMEDMPTPCYVGSSGDYAQRHNPFIYFDNIRNNASRCANIVPLTQFSHDLTASTLPDFIWITPNLCHDMHDCSVSTGDAWLKGFLPKIFQSSAWASSALFLVWDEGNTGAGCCQLAHGGHIPMLVISPLGKPGYTSRVNYDHASLLLTIETAWNLGTMRDSSCACTAVMSDFFA